MKSGSDSSEARCSSNEGGCGCVAMIFLHYVKEQPSENRFGGSEGCLSLVLTRASERDKIGPAARVPTYLPMQVQLQQYTWEVKSNV